jgi:hypothetical protein
MPAVSVKAASLRGIMMILSPAKTLDLSVWQPIGSLALAPTAPDCSPSQTLEVAKAMKGRKESELGKLLGISANLAKTASEVGARFDLRFHPRLSFYVSLFRSGLTPSLGQQHQHQHSVVLETVFRSRRG